MTTERKTRTDAIVVIVIVIVIAIAVAAGSSGWRATAARWTGGARGMKIGGAEVDPAQIPKLERPRGRRHDSPFNDAITARAESACVRSVESQLGFQLKEPFTAKVLDRYGVGDMDTGAGDSLDFDGLARAPSGRLSAWHCGMAHLSGYAGSPVITHSESP